MKRNISTLIISVLICYMAFVFITSNKDNKVFYEEITEQQLKKKLRNQKKMFVYFYSDYCSKCIYLKESIGKKQITPSIMGVNLDKVENNELIEEYGIASTPTMMIIVNQKIVLRLESVGKYDEVIEFYNESI